MLTSNRAVFFFISGIVIYVFGLWCFVIFSDRDCSWRAKTTVGPNVTLRTSEVTAIVSTTVFSDSTFSDTTATAITVSPTEATAIASSEHSTSPTTSATSPTVQISTTTSVITTTTQNSKKLSLISIGAIATPSKLAHSYMMGQQLSFNCVILYKSEDLRNEEHVVTLTEFDRREYYFSVLKFYEQDDIIIAVHNATKDVANFETVVFDWEFNAEVGDEIDLAMSTRHFLYGLNQTGFVSNTEGCADMPPTYFCIYLVYDELYPFEAAFYKGKVISPWSIPYKNNYRKFVRLNTGSSKHLSKKFIEDNCSEH